jgi:hypothetical protein
MDTNAVKRHKKYANYRTVSSKVPLSKLLSVIDENRLSMSTKIYWQN